MSSKRKATKSRSGTGSVYQRSDGQWVASIRFTDVDGSKRRRTVYGRTKTEAERKLEEVRRFIAEQVPVVQSRDAVGAHVTWWAASTLPVSHRRASTVQTYQTIVRTVIIPGIGAMSLDELTPTALDAWTTRMLDDGRSPATIRKALDVLGMALDVAVRDGKIRTNPVRDAGKPRITRTEVDFFTSSQIADLLAQSNGYRLDPLLRLAVYTGLRRGEALALRWRDVDLEARTLRVTGTLTRVKGRLIRQEPKTSAGTRVVPLVGDAYDALLDALTLQQADREASTYWTNQPGYVFTTESGEPVDPSNVGRWFTMIRNKAGLTTGSWHTLRHSAASTLLRTGTPMLVVSRLLGHSKVQITLDLYGHLTTSDIAEAVAVGFTGYGRTDQDNVVPLRSVANGL